MLVFHHIPKTAGTSLIAFLKQQHAFDRTCPTRDLATNVFLSPGESPLRAPEASVRARELFCGHYYFDLAPVLGVKPVRMSFFREPIERTISYYYHRRLTSDLTIERALEKGEITEERARFIRSARKMTLRDYLEHDGPGPGQDLLSDLQARATMAALGLDPDSALDGTAARTAVETFETVGITERFGPSVQLLCFERGFKYPGDLAALNERVSRSPYEKVDAEATAKIRLLTRRGAIVHAAAGEVFMDRYKKMIGVLFAGSSTHPRRFDHVVSMPFAFDSQRMIVQMLDAHWRRNAPRLFEKFPGSVQGRDGGLCLGMADAICGSGWLGRDGEDLEDPRTMSRWSGPGSYSELDFLVRPGRALSVTMDVAGAIQEDILEGLRVRANGRPVETVSEKKGDGRLVRFKVPADRVGADGYLSLGFTVPRTVSHHELNGADDRRPKGFRLSSVTIEPAATSSSKVPEALTEPS